MSKEVLKSSNIGGCLGLIHKSGSVLPNSSTLARLSQHWQDWIPKQSFCAPKDPEFYTPLALNCQKGQHLPALEVYKKQVKVSGLPRNEDVCFLEIP